MGNPLYAVRENQMGICPGCKFRTDSPQHFRIHIPRSKWPQEMQAPRKRRVVVNGLVLDADDPRAQVEPAWKRDPFAAPMGGLSAQAFVEAAAPAQYEAFERATVAIEEALAVSGEASAPASTVLADVADAGTASSPEAAHVCICGRAAGSAAGLAAHQRHCEQFKAVSA